MVCVFQFGMFSISILPSRSRKFLWKFSWKQKKSIKVRLKIQNKHKNYNVANTQKAVPGNKDAITAGFVDDRNNAFLINPLKALMSCKIQEYPRLNTIYWIKFNLKWNVGKQFRYILGLLTHTFRLSSSSIFNSSPTLLYTFPCISILFLCKKASLHNRITISFEFACEIGQNGEKHFRLVATKISYSYFPNFFPVTKIKMTTGSQSSLIGILKEQERSILFNKVLFS